MKLAFRVDASLQIGTGHVMRCLTLANAFAADGASCIFICRAHEGNLIDYIRSKGYFIHLLEIEFEKLAATSATTSTNTIADHVLDHSHWLGSSQLQDASVCTSILNAYSPDWLVVDHYGIDTIWETALLPYCRHLMVIDDLADRSHKCDVLLDQTLDRKETDYRNLLPENSQVLCGSRYALLRPEFASLRNYSLQRRVQPSLQHILISLGGVDMDNATSQVLRALQSCHLNAGCRITVVMGAGAPWLDDVRKLAATLLWRTQVLVDVSNMAQIMADSDLAIGAAGSSSWERCCLGVPTIMLVLAKNQSKVAQNLENVGAAWVIHHRDDFISRTTELLNAVIDNPEVLPSMILKTASVTDGSGVDLVQQITKEYS